VEVNHNILDKNANMNQVMPLPDHTRFKTSSIKYSRYLTPLRKDSVSFTGSANALTGQTFKFLSSLGRQAQNPTFPLIVSSIGALLFRTPIIASDKKTPKEERTYAATWLAVMSAIGLGVQLALRKPIGNFSNKLAKGFLNIKNPTTAQELTRVAGASKVFEFASWVATLNTVNIVIARYLKRGMDFINENIKGKPASKNKASDEPSTPEEKVKQKKIDKSIFTAIALLAGYTGLNILGKRLGRGQIATDAAKKIGQKLNQAFDITGNMKHLWSKAKKSLNKVTLDNSIIGKVAKNIQKAGQWPRTEKGMDWFAAQANAPDKWLDRSILSNLIIRPLILLPTGQYFTIISSMVNEALALLSLKTAGNFLVKKATPKLVSALKIPVNNPGARTGAEVLVDQGIKNIGMVCIGMGFLNNIISRNMLKKLKPMEDNNKETNFPSINSTLPNVKGIQAPNDMDAWLTNLKYKPANNYFNAQR